MKCSTDPQLENRHPFLKLCLCIIVVALFFYVIDWSFIDGGITAYEITCPQDFKEKNGCYALSKTTYYPNKTKQVVIRKSEYSIETLKKCTVINNENWECKWDDESAVFGFNNGQFHNTVLATKFFSWEESLKILRETQYVPRFIWLLERWDLI